MCNLVQGPRGRAGLGRRSGLVTEEEVCWARLAAACYQPRHAAPSTSTTKYHAIAIRAANKPSYKALAPAPGLADVAGS